MKIKLLNGWQEFKGKDLPEMAQKFVTKHNVFRSNGLSRLNAVFYYKGDIKTANEWIIVTNDGWYYKIGAQYMVWSDKYVLARWSENSLVKLLNALFAGNNPPQDPGYQT